MVERYEDQADSATERLLEHSWERRQRRASERELVVDAIAAALFAAVAGALLLTAGIHPRPGEAAPLTGTAALLIAVYALAARIEFPVGAGFVVPTQLVLVPMLLVLPPAAVPAAVGIGMALGNAVDWMFGRVPPRRVLSAVPDAWHAVGPALVLLLAGSPSDRIRPAAAAGRCPRRRLPGRSHILTGPDPADRRRAPARCADPGDRAGLGG